MPYVSHQYSPAGLDLSVEVNLSLYYGGVLGVQGEAPPGGGPKGKEPLGRGQGKKHPEADTFSVLKVSAKT